MKKAFLFGFLVLVLALSGCTDDGTGYTGLRSDRTPYSGTGPYDDPNTTYYNTGDPEYSNSGSGECGYYEGPCCEYIGTDAFGLFTAYNYCNDGLECRMDTCVEGPEYEAYDPRSH
jgi:hypothetical protein